MAYISADTFNRHEMAHVLKFMGYTVKRAGSELFAELDRDPVGMEKKYFKIFVGNDKIQRCYPYTDNQSYTNIRLMDKFCKMNNISFSVFEYIERKAEDLKFNLPKKLQVSDLKEYKLKDLGNILLGLGFFLRKDKSTLRFPVYEGEYPEGGKRILVVKMGKDGFVAFDNTHGGKVLDCISLVKEYNPTFRVFQIQQELDKLTSQDNKGAVPSKEPLSYCYLRKGYVARYMVLRGFDRDFLIDNKSLKGLLKTEVFFTDGKEYTNQVYIIRNVNNGEKVGYIRRNFSLYNGNLKGFSGGKKGLFYSNFKPSIKSIVLYGESFENTFSYYQMNLHKLGSGQVIIVASGGNPSNTQKEQFGELLSKVALGNLYLLGDNDMGGQKFNFYAIQKLIERSKKENLLPKIEVNKKDQVISLYSYDLNLSTTLGKKLEITSLEMEDTNLRKMAKISVAYDYAIFKKLNDLLISNYLDKNTIIIKSAEGNDFNYDLMKKSGMLEYIEQAKKFGLSDEDLLSEKKTKYMVIPEEARKNIQKLAQDIKDGRITAINAVELVKEEGKNIPGTISSNLKKVYKGKALTKEEIFTQVNKVKEKSGTYRR